MEVSQKEMETLITDCCKKDICCDKFERGMGEIVDMTIYCYGLASSPRYTSGVFKYCPWCGCEINSIAKYR